MRMLSHKKLLLGISGMMFLSWYIFSEGTFGTVGAHAAAVGAAPVGSLDLLEKLKFLTIIFEAIMILLHIMLQFVSALMEPEILVLTTGGAGGNNVLLQIWQLSRGITNAIFAFILIGVALFAVIRANEGINLIKGMVGKFVLAVILVNFSWFFPRVIIDVANVLTATIYQIPATIGVSCQNADGSPCVFVEQVWLFPDDADASIPDPCKGIGNDPNITSLGILCYKVAELDDGFNTGLGMLHGLYVNHAKILSLGKVIKAPGPIDGTWASIKQFSLFFVQFIFMFIYTLVAFFPLAAMAVVFFLRIIVIWLTVAFMPFMFVGFIIGDKMGEFNTMNLIFKKFVSAAFLPTAVAIPLAVGFIMINSAAGGPCPAGDPKFDFLCSPHGAILPGVNNLWTLLWNFAALAVIWVGFFSALKIDSLYANVGGVFESIGKNWMNFGLKAPLALPLIPTGRGNASVMETFGGAATAAIAKDPNLLISPTGRFDANRVFDRFNNGQSDNRTDQIIRNDEGLKDQIQEVVRALNSGQNVDAELLRQINTTLLRQGGSLSAGLNSQELQETLTVQDDGKLGNGKTLTEVLQEAGITADSN